ncbi:MAG: TetR/AcrR family transcriptional regulator [Chlorobi bacterium]|nr:TetR/AcrR family transcriptional regulator [Chlorobiota bacterium]
MGIPERKAREKQRRFNEIVDAAEKLFFRLGFDGVTMDDIAREAELAKGTLYLYFKSREDLHYAIVLRGLDILNRLIHEVYDRLKTGLENIRKMGEAYVRFFKEYPGYFSAIMYFDAIRFEKLQPEDKLKILDTNSPLMFFIDVLKEGQEDGSITHDVPAAELAVILWSQVSGVFDFIALRGKILDLLGIDPSELINHQFNVLSNGLQEKN